MFNLFSRAAFVTFFLLGAAPAPRGTATPGRLNEISEANQMGIVGPVPDTYL